MTVDGPRVSGPIPGPRSVAARQVQDRVFYPGLAHGAYPIVAAGKHGWFVDDIDGNTFVDLASSSASVPFGAGRADIVDAVHEQLLHFGNEDSHALTHPLMTTLAERLLSVAPGELSRVDLVPERHGGDRDRGAFHAPRDGASCRDRIPRRLPR